MMRGVAAAWIVHGGIAPSLCRSFVFQATYTLTGSFVGDSAISTTPITISTADPINSPRGTILRIACIDMKTAWTKLDHAVKAIKLRFAAGFRAATSKKMPSVA